MSRFHSKFHNKSHHTDATVGFLDSATDPIASETLPFQGDMWVNGVLRADTIVLSETIANLEVDTLVVNNTVTSFTVGSLTATTLVGDGSGVTNVNAATLGGFADGAFVKIAERGVANGVAPLDGDTHVPFENLSIETSLALSSTDLFFPTSKATVDYVLASIDTTRAITIDAIVDEVGGINKGQVVYLKTAVGGFPTVTKADNTSFLSSDVIAVAAESKLDGEPITIATNGKLDGLNTVGLAEGAILYLGTSGNITTSHPTGIAAVQRLGHCIFADASNGSILIQLDQLTIVNDHNGTMRHQIVNQNAGNFASTTYTLVNDVSHRSSISYLGSGWGAGNEHLGVYNEGYGRTIFTVDGNHGFEWNTDVTDSHNFTNTTKMTLTPEGFLGIGAPIPTQELHVLGAACVEHTAVEADEHGLEIVLDAAGFGDVKALDIDYITGAIGAGVYEGVILVNIDETAAAGGEVFALEVLTTTEGTDKIIAVKTSVGVDPISQDSGVFGDVSSILNDGVNVTAELSSGGVGNITMFVDVNDTITIGGLTNFSELEVLIDTGASQNVQPTWEYSIGAGWGNFTPTDGTNGFINTGVMLWDADDLAGWDNNSGEYLIRITRTRNGLATSPIVDTVKSATPDIYSWDKDGSVNISDLNMDNIPAFDTFALAAAAYPLAGKVWQTSGNGAGTIFSQAGIVMITQ